MDLDISFIVPIYNTPKNKIARCISSILDIKNLKYEVLLIDDGSDYKYSRVYKEYTHNKFVRYFYQKNQGVSAARNLGIMKAKGKYLMFVDADDYILSQALEKNYLNQNKELIIFNVDKRNRSRGKKDIFKLDNNVSIDSLLKTALNDGILNWVWAKLYLTEYVRQNKLTFSPLISTGEDFDYVVNYLKTKPSVLYVDKIIYVYMYNDITGLRRTLNNPMQIINDTTSVWTKRKSLLNYLAINDGFELKNVNEKYLNSLFELLAIFLYYRKYKKLDIKTLQQIILSKIEESKINIDELNFKTKFKIYLFKSQKYMLIYIYYAQKRIIKKILAMIFNNKLG